MNFGEAFLVFLIVTDYINKILFVLINEGYLSLPDLVRRKCKEKKAAHTGKIAVSQAAFS